MNNQNETQALENHLEAAKNPKLKLHQYISQDKRKTVNKYYIQLGKATISPVLNYNDMNHFIFGMTRAKKIQSDTKKDIRFDKLKAKHELIRDILIDYNCKEFGDCIIDEISEAVGIQRTTAYYEE